MWFSLCSNQENSLSILTLSMASSLIKWIKWLLTSSSRTWKKNSKRSMLWSRRTRICKINWIKLKKISISILRWQAVSNCRAGSLHQQQESSWWSTKQWRLRRAHPITRLWAWRMITTSKARSISWKLK